MPLAAGVERAIPATKSFTCQLEALYLLALYEAARLGRMDAAHAQQQLIERVARLARPLSSGFDAWRGQTA